MSLIKHEPLSLLGRMHSDLNDYFRINGTRLVPNLFSESGSPITNEWLPAVDVKENRKQFVITADLPGVDPKDIQVSMDNGYLSISGERKTEKEESDDNHRIRECSYGAFERRFSMPETADVNKITAKEKNGALTITIAKKKAGKAKLVDIKS